MKIEKSSIPKLEGNISKGLIAVGEGLENVVIDAKLISLIYFDEKPDRLKLNIMLGTQGKIFYLEDHLAIEFMNKYNQFSKQ